MPIFAYFFLVRNIAFMGQNKGYIMLVKSFVSYSDFFYVKFSGLVCQNFKGFEQVCSKPFQIPGRGPLSVTEIGMENLVYNVWRDTAE